jgi:hypothetical protein
LWENFAEQCDVKKKKEISIHLPLDKQGVVCYNGNMKVEDMYEFEDYYIEVNV